MVDSMFCGRGDSGLNLAGRRRGSSRCPAVDLGWPPDPAFSEFPSLPNCTLRFQKVAQGIGKRRLRGRREGGPGGAAKFLGQVSISFPTKPLAVTAPPP